MEPVGRKHVWWHSVAVIRASADSFTGRQEVAKAHRYLDDMSKYQQVPSYPYKDREPKYCQLAISAWWSCQISHVVVSRAGGGSLLWHIGHSVVAVASPPF